MDNQENNQRRNTRLVSEPTLQVSPSLAKVLGLKEAMFLQQVNYWLVIVRTKNQNFRDGYYWTYNSIRQWKDQFPFWSEDTIRRTTSKLVKYGILITGRFNKMPQDRTLWYRIDYTALKAYAPELDWSDMHTPNMQRAKLERCIKPQALPDTSYNNCSNNTESKKDTFETNNNIHKSMKFSNSEEYEICFSAMWDMYPRREGRAKVLKEQKMAIVEFGEEFERCIKRYCKKIDRDGIERKYVMSGSTFFNTGFIDYLDENYQIDEEAEKKNDDVELVVNMQ